MTQATGVLGGGAHVLGVVVLFASDLQSATPAGAAIFSLLLVVFVFSPAAIPTAVSAHTRLVSPVLAFVAISLAVAAPAFGVADPAATESAYGVAMASGLVVTLPLYAGAVEFAIRDGYGIGNERLRGLPSLPLSSPRRVAIGFSVPVGLTAAVIGLLFSPGMAIVFIFPATAAAAAVPLYALLSEGIIAPTVPFALLVPYTLYLHITHRSVSGMGFVFLIPAALVLSALLWKVESLSRARFVDWDGERFVD